MASIVFGTSVPANGAPSVVKQGGDNVADLTAAKTATALTVTDAAPVAAALAVLVADAASPTQAHVNTLAAAYATLAADITAANAAVATAQASTPSGSDVSVSINTTNVTKKYTLTKALRAIMFAVQGCSSIPE